MAFSFGFFNSKNLDRTYTAENFNDYLGSIICDGIQDQLRAVFQTVCKQVEADDRQRKGLDSGALFHFGYGIHL